MKAESPSQPTSTTRTLPVILGAGLTGVAISHALSAASVSHVLVGQRPGEEPRLGESLNAEGSLELREQFPAYAHFCHPKNHLALFFGPNALSFDFEAKGALRAFHEQLGFPSAIALSHIDRVGLDAALFDAAIQSPFCRHVEGRAIDLDYNRGTDRITAVQLSSGEVIAPVYVFDASNQARFVGRHLDVPCEMLGPRQRVVFAQYRPSGGTPASQWADTTSLLRLHRPDDAFDGLGWCIPLGDYVSLGINVEAEQVTQRDAARLLRLEEAYSARGIDVRGLFPVRGPIVALDYRHYAYERGHGRNWLLAGPSYCQTWFPSGAGIGTSLVAARFAVDVLLDPVRAGARYESYMRQIVAMHGALEWMSSEDPSSVSAAQLERRAAAMVRSNARRLAGYLALRGESGDVALRSVFARMYESDRLSATACRVVQAPVEEQAWRVFRRTRPLQVVAGITEGSGRDYAPSAG